MRVLVTGAAGHLGSTLVGYLLRQDIEVTGVDVLRYGGEGLLGYASDPGFRFARRDVTTDLSDLLNGHDAVVHLAALVGPVCEQDPQAAWAINCESTKKLAATVKRSGTRFMFASTCSNYGIAEGIADEDAPLRPLGTYAQTKVAAEGFLRELGGQAVTLRLGTLGGMSPRPRFDTLLNQLTWQGYSTGRVECQRPGARRPFLHVRDAAAAIATILSHWSSVCHSCYNLVGFNTTKRDLAEAVRACTGCTVEYRDEAADTRDYFVSGDRARHDFGVQPQFDMDQCIEEVYRTLRDGLVRPRPEHFNV